MPMSRRQVIGGAGLAGAALALGACVDHLIVDRSTSDGPAGGRSPVAPSAGKPNPGIPANWRNIASGWPIPDEAYADQPYIVKADDGAWVCAITTSGGDEGANSQ